MGCKLERDAKQLKIMQPVLMQSFGDKLDLPEGLAPTTPAEPGSVLMKARDDEAINGKVQLMYWFGVRKLIHMMKWSRPDVLNAV